MRRERRKTSSTGSVILGFAGKVHRRPESEQFFLWLVFLALDKGSRCFRLAKTAKQAILVLSSMEPDAARRDNHGCLCPTVAATAAKTIKAKGRSKPGRLFRQSLILLALAVPPCFAQEAVHIPDPHLKAAIENELWVWDPTVDDMLGLTSLNLSARKIKDLTGLEYAKNLHSLRVTHNQVEDLSPLAKLKNLQTLVPNNNLISDLSPLSGLTQLRHLDLHENKIESVTPLSGLIHLEYLNLHENQIRRLAGLAGLVSLERLDLNNNPIEDLSPLGSLDRLLYLNLSNNQLYDISGLSGLSGLVKLYLYNNQISDLSPLSGLTQLELLSLPNNRIGDITTLSGLVNLSELYLQHNQINDISPLCDLSNLSMLWVHDNPLSPQACASDIPQILAHNPNMIECQYDACTTQYGLTISSSAGGAVSSPGEGDFPYALGTPVSVTATTYGQHHFVNWTGTAVTAGKVDDPHALSTTVTVDGRFTLIANFAADPSDLPTVNPDEAEDDIHVDDDAVHDPGPNDLSISDAQEDGTADHPYDSIQEAIDQAQAGDTILVHEGRYYEILTLMGKGITIRRFAPGNSDVSAYPVVDAQNQGPVLTFSQGEDPSCVVSGLVLTGGHDSHCGAIACISASPTIKNCLIVGNRSTDPAGAIIYCEDSQSLLQNLTVAHNACAGSGSALTFVKSDVIISNSIIWGNATNEIKVASGNDPTIVYSNVQGSWPGVGNIAADPLFASPSHGATPNVLTAVWMPEDYHLLSEAGRWNPPSLTWVTDGRTSPCIDAGDPSDSWTGEPRPHGAGINMGAYGGTEQASCSLRAAPMVARWTFNESTGNQAFDVVGHHHGTVVGATWADGILDGALQFDGVDDYVDCGNDPVLVPPRFTVSLWLHAQATSGSRTVLKKGAVDQEWDLFFELFGARYATLSFGDGAQSLVLYASSKLALGEWVHIALTRDDTDAAMYVNGSQLIRKAYDFAPVSTDHNLIIGGGLVQPYQGKIDDVCIYGSVLSDEDIADLAAELE